MKRGVEVFAISSLNLTEWNKWVVYKKYNLNCNRSTKQSVILESSKVSFIRVKPLVKPTLNLIIQYDASCSRAAVKNVRLGEADGLKNFHPQKWVPNAMK